MPCQIVVGGGTAAGAAGVVGAAVTPGAVGAAGCSELGGRPYLYGVNNLDRALADRLYGNNLDQLAQLRAAHRLENVNAHLPLVRAAVPT